MKNRKKIVSILAGIMAVIMVLGLILSLIPPAFAASSSEIRNQINDLKTQQNQLRREMADLRDQYEKNEDQTGIIITKYIHHISLSGISPILIDITPAYIP